MKPTCTHVALFCRDIEASVAFYSRHVGLHEIHRRNDDGTIVVWMGEESASATGEREERASETSERKARASTTQTGVERTTREADPHGTSLVIVLLGIHPPGGEGAVAHLGYAVASRQDVDDAAERGHASGLDVQGPVEAGPIVGYYCLLRDPDGNWVEFSHGQALGPAH